jgi:putative solute:sodium symporter small subunit
MARADRSGYWRRTGVASFATVFFAACVLLLFERLGTILDDFALIGLPLGYLMAVLGLPLLLVALTFWYAGRQDDIDRLHGMAEDD